MNVGEKTAPTAGTLVYYIDENTFDGTMTKHTYVVLYEWSTVKLVRVFDPFSDGLKVTLIDYHPDRYKKTVVEAAADAIKRITDKIVKLETTAVALKRMGEPNLLQEK